MPERHVQTLFQPPSTRRFWRKTAPFWEKLGSRFGMILSGGVLMVEVSKRVHMPSGPGVRDHRPAGLKVLGGLTAPKPPAVEPARRL